MNVAAIEEATGVTTLQAEQLLRDHPETVILDVTDEDEWERTSLPGAKNAPWGEGFKDRVSAAAPDPAAPVLVYGHAHDDARVESAARRMASLGYTKIHVLTPGKLGWMQNGLPTE